MKRTFTLIGVLLIAASAAAHTSPTGQVYDPYCCNATDCANIPAHAVVAGPEGWIVTLDVGDHFLVETRTTWTIPYGEERPSTDGEFHARLWPTAATLHCLYVPPMDF